MFPFLIGFSALSVSTSAAFYSVSGLSKLFAGASLEVMSGNKLVLQNDGTNGDNLEALCSAASSLDVTVSVLEDV